MKTAYPENTDSELVTMVQSDKDEDAFVELIDRHKNQIFAMIKGILINHEDAEDVWQEAIIKAWRKIDHFEGRSSFNTWLYSIAFNMSLNERKKRQRRNSHEISICAIGNQDKPEDPANFIPSLRMKPCNSFDSKILLHLIARARRDAPNEDQRDVLELSEDGIDQEKIAQIVGASRGTVTSRLYYGRRQILHYLMRELGEEEVLELLHRSNLSVALP